MLGISPNEPPSHLYETKLNTLSTLHTPHRAKVLAKWLLGLFILGVVVLFLPWQQNIRAEGELTALSPADRPQIIPSPIDGKIESWLVSEGQYVDSGQVLLTISEIKDKYFDPALLERIQERIEAKENTIKAKGDKVLAKDKQLEALRNGLKIKLQQIDYKITQYKLKVISDSAAWEASIVDLENYKRQFFANQTLYDSGLIPLVKLELAKSKYQQGIAKEVSSRTKYNATKAEYQNTLLSKSVAQAEALDKIAKAESERSATFAEIADSQGALAKERNEYANMEIRTGRRTIRAPRSGYIVKAQINGLGDNVKLNQPLLTMVADHPKLAVALFVPATDVPLLSIGRHVRLQFDGWPAIQFSGWPSVSVGTFGGRVEVIDFFASPNGLYRILVTPELQLKDDEWPPELRMGSGVHGWVMLDDVPIWYELWREINRFPPSLKSKEESKEKGKEDKGKKK